VITIEADDNGLGVRLQGLADGMQDLSPVWKGPVHDIFTSMMREQFEKQGAYSGEAWKPLSPQYAEWKAKRAPGKPIMELWGYLKGSLLNEGDGADWHVFRSGPSWAEYGTRINYAATHHFGDESRNIPRRQVIPKMTKAEGRNIAYAITAFLLGKMRLRR